MLQVVLLTACLVDIDRTIVSYSGGAGRGGGTSSNSKGEPLPPIDRDRVSRQGKTLDPNGYYDSHVEKVEEGHTLVTYKKRSIGNNVTATCLDSKDRNERLRY